MQLEPSRVLAQGKEGVSWGGGVGDKCGPREMAGRGKKLTMGALREERSQA